MKLVIQSQKGKTLARQLADIGFPLDLRCGGRGVCGGCRVTLLSGSYRTPAGRVEVTRPTPVNACQASLLGDSGELEIPEVLLRGKGRILSGWDTHPLPDSPDTVVAVDLGTTTVAAVKLCRGEVVAEAGAVNRQSRFGADVLSRIVHASKSPEQLDELRQAAVDSLNEVLDALGSGEVQRIGVAANTVMSLLLHGIDPAPVGSHPFLPPCRSFPVRTAGVLGLNAPAGAPVRTVPCISGYLGGDLVAGLGELSLQKGDMLIDIGTNCEILFHAGTGWFGASAAAGPAFEGEGIGSATRAMPGAIDHWFGEGGFSVLGDVEPSGLCGSALIDFLAVERRRGALDEFGRYVPKRESFALAPGIALGEEDVETILKAKAAVRAGIDTLAHHCGTPVETIYLAGGFARYLNLENAIAIGMLPAGCRYRIVGNAALAGAARLAVDPWRIGDLETLAGMPKEVPLAGISEFESAYIDALLLP